MITRDCIAILERTPRILRAWLDGMPAEWVRCDTGMGWVATQFTHSGHPAPA